MPNRTIIRRRIADSLPYLLFLLLPLISFPELIWREQTLYRGDLTWIHYPLRLFAAEQWLTGQIPLWNPYVMTGLPLLAEAQIGVLQPLNALFALPLPPYRLLTIFVMVHFILAASSTYLLMRSLGLSRTSATISGLTFGFGGVLMGQVTNLNIMAGVAWLPLVFGGLLWTFRTRRHAVALLAGLPLTMHIFAAHPQVPFFSMLLLIAYSLYESMRHLRHAAWRQAAQLWGLFISMVSSGLLLAMPQILPTWEMQRLSVRAMGVNTEQLSNFAMPPLHWLTLLLPNAFGTSVTGYHGLAGNFEETSIYLGLLPLLLIPLSWRAYQHADVDPKRPALIPFLWLITLGGVILSAGSYTPLFAWLQQLPGFNLFRAPTRWLFIVNFAGALLAAYGMESLLRRPLTRHGHRLLLSLWLGLAGLLLILWLFNTPLFQWADAQQPRTEFIQGARELLRRGLFETPEEYGSHIILSRVTFWLTPAIALLSRLGGGIILLIGLSYTCRRPVLRAALLTMLMTLVALDMAVTGGTAVNRITEASHWQQLSPAVQQLLPAQADKKQPQFRFFTTASSDESDVVAALKHYFPALYHLPASGGHSPLRLARYDQFMSRAHPANRMALSGTRFVLEKGRLTADAESLLQLVFTAEPWYLYEYAETLPRAFIMRHVEVVPTDEAALTYLQNGSFEPGRTLLLHQHQQHEPEHAPTMPPQPDVVEIVRDQPQAVTVQVDLATPGYLVLLDPFYPGWQAWVDDQPREILRAYYRNRAVWVPAGQHTVEFLYRPWSFYDGVIAALFGLILLGGALWQEWKRGREAHGNTVGN